MNSQLWGKKSGLRNINYPMREKQLWMVRYKLAIVWKMSELWNINSKLDLGIVCISNGKVWPTGGRAADVTVKDLRYSPMIVTLNVFVVVFSLEMVSLYCPECLILVFVMVRDPVFWSTCNLPLNPASSVTKNEVKSCFLFIWDMTESLGPNIQSIVSSFSSSERLVCRATESPSITVTDSDSSVSVADTPGKQTQPFTDSKHIHLKSLCSCCKDRHGITLQIVKGKTEKIKIIHNKAKQWNKINVFKKRHWLND